MDVHDKLDELSTLIESARAMPMSASCVVNRAQVLDLLDEVRSLLPDSLAQAADTIAFCEVKTRRGDAFGLPVEAVTARKRQRLRMLAARWLDVHEGGAGSLRFDVASVRPDGRGGWAVEMFENAF